LEQGQVAASSQPLPPLRLRSLVDELEAAEGAGGKAWGRRAVAAAPAGGGRRATFEASSASFLRSFPASSLDVAREFVEEADGGAGARAVAAKPAGGSRRTFFEASLPASSLDDEREPDEEADCAAGAQAVAATLAGEARRAAFGAFSAPEPPAPEAGGAEEDEEDGDAEPPPRREDGAAAGLLSRDGDAEPAGTARASGGCACRGRTGCVERDAFTLLP